MASVSLAATAVLFDAVRWLTYTAGNLLLALTYCLIGALIAPIAGRVGGVFLAFLIPFLDIGVTQSPMLHPEPTTLSRLLPGYGGSRILLDGALTAGFDESLPLLAGLVWLLGLLGLLVAVVLGHRHAITPSRVCLDNGSYRATGALAREVPGLLKRWTGIGFDASPAGSRMPSGPWKALLDGRHFPDFIESSSSGAGKLRRRQGGWEVQRSRP